MKRYMLVPETVNKRGLPTDVRQKLTTFRNEKGEYINIPPHIRPQPLVKYESRQYDETLEADESPPTAPSEPLLELKLPGYAQRKAVYLAPFFNQIKPALPANIDANTLFLDLVKRGKRKLNTRAVLLSTAKRLLAIPGFNKAWLDPNLVVLSKTSKQSRAGPSKRKRLITSSEDDIATEEDEARPSATAHSDRSGNVATANPNHNQWSLTAGDVAKKPSWFWQ